MFFREYAESAEAAGAAEISVVTDYTESSEGVETREGSDITECHSHAASACFGSSTDRSQETSGKLRILTVQG